MHQWSRKALRRGCGRRWFAALRTAACFGHGSNTIEGVVGERTGERLLATCVPGRDVAVIGASVAVGEVENVTGVRVGASSWRCSGRVHGNPAGLEARVQNRRLDEAVPERSFLERAVRKVASGRVHGNQRGRVSRVDEIAGQSGGAACAIKGLRESGAVGVAKAGEIAGEII